MDDLPPIWFTDSLAALVERRELTEAQMRAFMQAIMSGRCGDLEAATILTALRTKGETAGELAAAASVLREQMVRVETGRNDVLDTCGTGGDHTGTFNISTTTALVVAGAGVPVVKHGNRAVSSSSGSAEVLQALGVTVREDPAWVRGCLDQTGLAFCFAPHFHPGLRHVAEIRRRLKVRTLFNCLGPLANPAGAAFQLLGVGHANLLDPMAGALARLGTRHAFLVCGRDGLDEVGLSCTTLVREVCGERIKTYEWTATDFGLEGCSLDELKVAGPAESAVLIGAILAGQDGPAARVVIANAAAALLAAERVHSLREGVTRATEALRSGKARQVLEQLVACSRGKEIHP